MSRFTPFVALALLAPLAGGCASFLPKRSGGTQRADEKARLEQRVADLQRQTRMNEVEIARLRRQVAELAERVEERAADRRVSQPVREPLRSAASSPVESPLPERSTSGVEAEDLDTEPPPSDPPAATPVAPPVTGDGQALYDRGYILYHQGRYIDSETAFRGFLQQYAASDLADNAQFWIGEARLRRDDLQGALAAFRETVSRFPRGNKVPDALFRVGHCLEEMGDLDGARTAWRQTIDRYPNSAAAALSEERLAAVP